MVLRWLISKMCLGICFDCNYFRLFPIPTRWMMKNEGNCKSQMFGQIFGRFCRLARTWNFTFSQSLYLYVKTILEYEYTIQDDPLTLFLLQPNSSNPIDLKRWGKKINLSTLKSFFMEREKFFIKYKMFFYLDLHRKRFTVGSCSINPASWIYGNHDSSVRADKSICFFNIN